MTNHSPSSLTHFCAILFTIVVSLSFNLLFMFPVGSLVESYRLKHSAVPFNTFHSIPFDRNILSMKKSSSSPPSQPSEDDENKKNNSKTPKKREKSKSPSRSNDKEDIGSVTATATKPAPSTFSWKDVVSSSSSVGFSNSNENEREQLQSTSKQTPTSKSGSPFRRKMRSKSPSVSERAFSTTNPPKKSFAQQQREQQLQLIHQKNEIVLQDVQSLPQEIQLMVLLCGIPGSGKSTFARRIVETSQKYYDVSYEDGTVFDQVEENQLLRQQDYQEDYYAQKEFFETEPLESNLSQPEYSIAKTKPVGISNHEERKKLHFLREWIAYTQDQFKSRKIMERYCYDAILKGYNVIVDRCNFDAEQRKHWIQMMYDYYSTYYEQQRQSYGNSGTYYPYGDISPPLPSKSYSSLAHYSTDATNSNSYLSSTFQQQRQQLLSSTSSYQYPSRAFTNPYAYEYFQSMIPDDSLVTEPPPVSKPAVKRKKPFYILCVMVPNYDNLQVCSKRATVRGASDGLHDANTDWRKVCASMVQSFEYPTLDESIDGIYQCQNDDDLEALFQSLLFVLPDKVSSTRAATTTRSAIPS